MALVFKANKGAGFQNAFARIAKSFFGAVDFSLQNIPMWRHSGTLPELPREVINAQSGSVSKVRKSDTLCEVLFDVFEYAVQLQSAEPAFVHLELWCCC